MQCADHGTRKQASASLGTFAPLVSTAAIGINAFFYCIALVSLSGLSLKARDSTLFALGIAALPPLTVLIQQGIENRIKSEELRSQIEAINTCVAASALAGLALIAVLSRVLKLDDAGWTRSARILLIATVTTHVAALLLFALRARNRRICRRVPAEPSTTVVFSVISYAIAAAILFKVDPTQPYFSPFIRTFLDPPFAGHIGAAIGCAIAMVFAASILYIIESALLRRRSAILHTLQIGALCLAITLTLIVYFDFSLNLDPVHYLTIAAPAMHMFHGGTVMVDTFSQYGPGPVFVTICAWLVGPRTLGTVQIAAQLANLAFYVIWLVCLFRMTRWKATASLLGFAAVAVLLACWDYGNGNVNVAPSILGLRHLPTLCMVLSISCLQPPARSSIFTVLCTALAGLWSVECLIGTLGIHLLSIATINLQARTYRRLVTDAAWATSPLLLSIAVLSAATLVRSGSLPDYRTYLQFLRTYNPTSAFWSHAADSQFLAWITILLAVFLVLCDSWRCVFRLPISGPHIPPNRLYYKFLPMTALVALTAAYYAFRSYDYTLLIAFLPFAALAIPGTLSVANRLLTVPGPAKLLLAIPIFVSLSTLTFCWLALTRPDAPYSFLLQECRDQGRCTISALFQGLKDTARRRVLMERTGSSISDRYGDNPKTSQLVPDAVRLIQQESRSPDVTVLLGETVASELALIYTDHWQRWPISFAYTDALVRSLAERIIAAPITLKTGELVIVRRNPEGLLQEIEAGILQRVQREYVLCPIADTLLSVDSYRVAAKGSRCP
jgi:hypothetical protein